MAGQACWPGGVPAGYELEDSSVLHPTALPLCSDDGTIGAGNDRLVSTAALPAYVASATLITWGTAHLAPTRAVVASFGAISVDNRRILVMEWMAEGITHIAIGVLVILATAIEGVGDATTKLIYIVSAAVLLTLAGLTAATGSRTQVIWFRVCPFVLTAAGALLVAASLV
jgi:hypothetical protein